MATIVMPVAIFRNGRLIAPGTEISVSESEVTRLVAFGGRLLPGQKPVVEEPVVEEPIVEEPIVEEPIVEEPIVEEPVVEKPPARRRKNH